MYGTRFQAHVHRGLSNVIRNFLTFILFTENAEEQRMGKDVIVTRKVYPKIIGFRKDWTNYGTIATAYLFLNVLSEISALSLIMETDSVLIYQLLVAVSEVCANLDDLVEEKEDQLPTNMEIVDEDPEEDSINIKVSATNATLKQYTKAKDLTEEDRRKIKKNVKIVHENFKLSNAATGKEKTEKLQKDFASVIKQKITERFSNLLQDESFKAVKLFDTNDWYVGEESDELKLLDATKLDTLHDRFKVPLTMKEFDIKECKKEWKV